MLTYIYSNNGGLTVYASEQDSKVIDQALHCLEGLVGHELASLPFDTDGKVVKSTSCVEMQNQLSRTQKSLKKEDLEEAIRAYEVFTKILGRTAVEHRLLDVPMIKDYTQKMKMPASRPRPAARAFVGDPPPWEGNADIVFEEGPLQIQVALPPLQVPQVPAAPPAVQPPAEGNQF